MNWLKTLFTSSLGKKLIMALTGLFLITFLVVHLSVNLTLFGGPDAFNGASHFMQTNPIVSTIKPLLVVGFLFHIIYGIVVTWKNFRSRKIRYVKNKPGKSSSWASRNMIWTGIIVMLFTILHLGDFERQISAGNVGPNGKWATDYDMVTSLFNNPTYTGIYVVAFILLGIHLNHGFQSAFQTMGARHSKWKSFFKSASLIFCILIAAGFSAIAIWFYLN